MNTKYIPKPIDTSKVVIPPELKELAELLAENAHENWSHKRMEDGWRYGVLRNDAEKLHPDLIPYAELSDGEKEFDRVTSMETIKVLLALGYEIKKR